MWMVGLHTQKHRKIKPISAQSAHKQSVGCLSRAALRGRVVAAHGLMSRWAVFRNRAVADLGDQVVHMLSRG